MNRVLSFVEWMKLPRETSCVFYYSDVKSYFKRTKVCKTAKSYLKDEIRSLNPKQNNSKQIISFNGVVLFLQYVSDSSEARTALLRLTRDQRSRKNTGSLFSLTAKVVVKNFNLLSSGLSANIIDEIVTVVGSKPLINDALALHKQREEEKEMYEKRIKENKRRTVLTDFRTNQLKQQMSTITQQKAVEASLNNTLHKQIELLQTQLQHNENEFGQQSAHTEQLFMRIESLEQENKALREETRDLRKQVAELQSRRVIDLDVMKQERKEFVQYERDRLAAMEQKDRAEMWLNWDPLQVYQRLPPTYKLLVDEHLSNDYRKQRDSKNDNKKYAIQATMSTLLLISSSNQMYSEPRKVRILYSLLVVCLTHTYTRSCLSYIAVQVSHSTNISANTLVS